MTIDYAAAASTVAYELMGTCQYLTFVLEAHEFDGFDSNQEFCDRLDSLVWECKVCGWWTEPCDVDENDVCDDCRDGEED